MGKRWVVALAVGLVCLGAVGSSAGSALAVFPTAADFADWTAVSNNVATGTLLGHTVTFSGTTVDDPPSSTIDGTSNLLSESMFTPPITLGDHLSFRVFAPSTSYTLDFGAATTDPVIDLGSLGSTLTFPAGTSISRISGDPGLTVAGNVVNGAGNTTVDPVGLNDSNGTIQLNGTFQSISFSATTAYPLDGVYLQVGASPPPPPPTTPTSGGAGASQPPPPPPQVTSLQLGGSTGAGAASRALVTAQFAGQASQLEWYVAGSHRPVLTTSAALSTLRFHQSPTGSIVGVRAIGLGERARSFSCECLRSRYRLARSQRRSALASTLVVRCSLPPQTRRPFCAMASAQRSVRTPGRRGSRPRAVCSTSRAARCRCRTSGSCHRR